MESICGFLRPVIFLHPHIFIKNQKVSTKLKNIDLNNWQYGLTLSLGYNNWNGFICYGLNPMFNDATIHQNSIDSKSDKNWLDVIFLVKCLDLNL